MEVEVNSEIAYSHTTLNPRKNSAGNRWRGFFVKKLWEAPVRTWNTKICVSKELTTIAMPLSEHYQAEVLSVNPSYEQMGSEFALSDEGLMLQLCTFSLKIGQLFFHRSRLESSYRKSLITENLLNHRQVISSANGWDFIKQFCSIWRKMDADNKNRCTG